MPVEFNGSEVKDPTVLSDEEGVYYLVDCYTCFDHLNGKGKQLKALVSIMDQLPFSEACIEGYMHIEEVGDHRVVLQRYDLRRLIRTT